MGTHPIFESDFDCLTVRSPSARFMSAKEFLNYVNASPSPYHAVDETRKMLKAANYKEWSERDHWNVKPGDKFFVTRNQSCITALAIRGKDGKVSHHLVHINKPILRVPNLCIHLNRSVNDGFAPNTETEIVPILAQAATYELNKVEKPAEVGRGISIAGKHHPLFIRLIEQELGVEAKDILDVELCFADHQPGQIGGAFDEYIFAPRLDNLCCCFAGIKGLLDADDSLENDDLCRMVTLFDNEEVGSGSAQGACSSLMEYYLRRVAADPSNLTSFEEAISRSYCISADMVHALHPNYPQKHESNHRPMLCQGVTIKTNSNQRYATTAVTASLFHQIADAAGITIQDVMVRNDSACGSTIGPITSENLGMRVIDVGIPQLSMHSCREMMGTASIDELRLLSKTFFEKFSEVDKNTSVDL